VPDDIPLTEQETPQGPVELQPYATGNNAVYGTTDQMDFRPQYRTVNPGEEPEEEGPGLSWFLDVPMYDEAANERRRQMMAGERVEEEPRYTAEEWAALQATQTFPDDAEEGPDVHRDVLLPPAPPVPQSVPAPSPVPAPVPQPQDAPAGAAPTVATGDDDDGLTPSIV
jgi:hypothetical protein